MTLKPRIIPCLDVGDGPRRPQPQSGEDKQDGKVAGL
jgi:imidazole glycerol phosphate synthase subunit HisF